MDQLTHLYTLISTFLPVICSLKNKIAKLARCKITIFQLVFLAGQAGIYLTWWQTPKIIFKLLPGL